MPFKMHKIIIFLQKKNNSEKACVPTLPKIFGPIIQNTLIFYLAEVIFLKAKGNIVLKNLKKIVSEKKTFQLPFRQCLSCRRTA